MMLARMVTSLATLALVRAEAAINTEPGYPRYRLGEGRSLYYRSSPGLEAVRSPVHELYMRPYNYANLVRVAVAVVAGDGISGHVTFTQTGGPTAAVKVSGKISGLSPGYHGFHVHQLGDMTNGCKSMKGHFNPLQYTHGAPDDETRHVGDLGNIMADSEGVAVVEMEDTWLSLNGINSIIGRGVVIHAGMDDLGKGGDDGSLKTGNAGGRVACAVIGLSESPV